MNDDELIQISTMVQDILDMTQTLETELNGSPVVIATALLSSAIKYSISKIGEEGTATNLRIAASGLDGSGERPDWLN